MKRQSLLMGSLILAVAGVITKFLGLFFRWPLIMLIGDEGVGYYQMAYPLYMVFIAMASGVPIAISKIISENNAKGSYHSNFVVVREGIILMTILGGGLSFILCFFAGYIIDFLKWDNKAYYSLVGISFAPVITAITMVLRGYFQGHQNMNYTACSQVIEQLGRILIGIGLAVVLLPRGVEFSAGAASFGAAAGGAMAGIFLVFMYEKEKKKSKVIKIRNSPNTLSKILKISVPISLGATVSAIMTLIDSLLVPHKLIESGYSSVQSTVLYSQLTGKAAVIVNIPLTLTTALCTSIIPIIAELYLLNKKVELENKVNLAVKLSLLISIPSAVALFCLAGPILNFIFPGRAEGAQILKYMAIVVPFIVITQTTTSIFQGIGKYNIPIATLIFGCITKVCLTLFLVGNPKYNIYGAVIATISAYVLISVLNVILLKFISKIKLDLYRNIIKISNSSLIMIISVIILYRFIFIKTSSNAYSCLLSILAGVIIYTVSILAFKIVNSEDIKKRLR